MGPGPVWTDAANLAPHGDSIPGPSGPQLSPGRTVNNNIYCSSGFLLHLLRAESKNSDKLSSQRTVHSTEAAHTPRSRAETGEATVATCSLLLSTYQIKGTSAAPCLLPTDTQLRLHTTTGRAVHLSIDLSISLVHTERCVIYCNLMLVCHSPILISYQRHVPQPAYKMKQGKYTVSKISLKENYIQVRIHAYRAENGLVPAHSDATKQIINQNNKKCDNGNV